MTDQETGGRATVFITICARNYLGFALSLGRSIKQHHPEARFVTWLIDGNAADALTDEIELGFVSDILDADELAHLRLLYNVRELSTASRAPSAPRARASTVDAAGTGSRQAPG